MIPLQNLRVLRLGVGKLGFDFLGVCKALGDPLAAHFQSEQNGLVGEVVQRRADEQKADDVGEEQRPVDAELLARLAGRLKKALEKTAIRRG